MSFDHDQTRLDLEAELASIDASLGRAREQLRSARTIIASLETERRRVEAHLEHLEQGGDAA